MNNSLWGCVEQRSRRGAINTQCVTCINNGIFYWRINKHVSGSAEIPTWAGFFWLYKKISHRLCGVVGDADKWNRRWKIIFSLVWVICFVSWTWARPSDGEPSWSRHLIMETNIPDEVGGMCLSDGYWSWRGPLLNEISSGFLCYQARWINNNEPFPIWCTGILFAVISVLREPQIQWQILFAALFSCNIHLALLPNWLKA